jgi:hypothetical protein
VPAGAGPPAQPGGRAARPASPADPATKARLAALAQLPAQQRFATAASLYAAALAQLPALVPDHRYNAACCAALASCSQGKDAATLNATGRLRWRRQALTWLRAELAALGRQQQTSPPEQSAQTGHSLEHWRRASKLAGVREKEALARLPAEEQAAWQKLWAEVEALLAPSAPGK